VDTPLIPERLFGIIGHPLAQTLSPLLHNWGFKRLGVKAAFMAFPTPPERLEEFMRAVRALPVSGVSVTIPHKEAVVRYLDGVSESAKRTGAVNTLVWEDGRLVGRNTDVAGFLAPLRERETTLESALVLGAGGAARAVLAGLQELGVLDVTLSNRDRARADNLAGEFHAAVADWERREDVRASLVVNATPLGMKGKAEDDSPMSPGYWRAGQTAYDLVYNPRETLFLRQARAAGADAIDGLAMFAGQGAAQFKLWTGLELPANEASALLARALGM
jgi:shikimate dehydrogenase